MFKESSASPNSFIPLSTTNKLNGFNYSNSNLSSNFSKRDISREKNRQDPISLRPNNFVPETTKSPIKIFSPTNKTLVLSTKNKYSNLGSKIESFFTKKDLTKKSSSPRRNLPEEKKDILIDIRSVDRVKPIFNYKNNKPNTLKLYTKAASPNNQTPRSINDASKAINTTKNRSRDIVPTEYNSSQAQSLRDKIVKFCKKNNLEVIETDKPGLYEVKNNHQRFKIEVNSRSASSKPFKVTHIKGKEEVTKEIMMQLINNIDQEN